MTEDQHPIEESLLNEEKQCGDEVERAARALRAGATRVQSNQLRLRLGPLTVQVTGHGLVILLTVAVLALVVVLTANLNHAW